MRQREVVAVHRLHQLAQRERHRLEGQPSGLDLGQVEHVGDHFGQALRAVHELGQVLLAHRRLEGRLLRHPRQAEQSVQRRADLVAGVMRKRSWPGSPPRPAFERRGKRAVDAPALGDVLAIHSVPPSDGRVALTAWPIRRHQKVPVGAAHLALELERGVALAVLHRRATDFGVVGRAGPERRHRFAVQPPRSQPNIRSQLGLTRWKWPSRTNAMPTGALCRIAHVRAERARFR